MKILIVFILALCAQLAHADARVDNMAAQCQTFMDSGACRVAVDPKDYPNATIPLIQSDGSVVRVSKDLYVAIRALGFTKDAQGRWLMCQKVFDACQQWDSDACRVVRQLWRQAPP
jgi:hypothetical protein